MADTGMAPREPARSPLWAVLSLAFLGSIGTGIFTNGIFFLATHAYGFTTAQNYLLGLVLGVTYSAAALGAGPFVRRLEERGRRKGGAISTRTVLGWILVVMVAVCLLPLAMEVMGRGELHWPLWVLVLIYSPLTGMQWPLIESFLSGGRRGKALRSATGRFNITWSSALVVGMWGLGPLIGEAGWAIGLLGAVHFVSLPLLAWIGAEPGRHLDVGSQPHPPVYDQLLVVFRILLPTSYIVSTALVPFLPAAMNRLEVSSTWQTPLTATWMAARFGMFFLLERWHAWHGRWYPAIAGVVFMLGGFAMAVFSPRLAGYPLEAGVLMMGAGLAIFGIGMATIYAGALYYAMAVGNAEVSAGGMHEALIGAGYTIGPLCGLAAVALVAGGVVRPEHFNASMLTLVGVIAVAALVIALRLAWGATRQNIHKSRS